MSERLTPEEIEQLRAWQDTDITDLSYALQQRTVAYLLHLHDTLERLRTLQPEDVTEQQRVEWLGSPFEYSDRAPLHRKMMAAAVRVMLASLDKPADSA